MSKKVIFLVMASLMAMAIALAGCSSSGGEEQAAESEDQAAVEEQVATGDQAEGAEEATEQEAEEAAETVYQVGDTWTVDGQWSFTINSVTATDERNEYSELEPAAVYKIEYTYENLGYEVDYMNGLFISPDMGSIVDADGKMGYSYPGDILNYAVETPVGATCEAEVFIGVDNPGDFTITMNLYDSNEEKHTAKFNLTV